MGLVVFLLIFSEGSLGFLYAGRVGWFDRRHPLKYRDASIARRSLFHVGAQMQVLRALLGRDPIACVKSELRLLTKGVLVRLLFGEANVSRTNSGALWLTGGPRGCIPQCPPLMAKCEDELLSGDDP
jgi:hypothetical protein